MDYDKAFWTRHKHLNGEALADDLGIDGGSARRLIRKAKRDHPDLWPDEQPKTRMGVAVFDLHHPLHDKKLWGNILRFVGDSDPDVFLFGGDNQDLGVVSHWNENKRRRVEGKRLKQDYETFVRDVLDPLETVLRDDAERIYHLGNHEAWVEQYIDQHPEVEGFFEVENNLPLDRWQVLDYGETSKVGHLHFTHGTYINIHNALKTAQVYGRCVAYGHGHTFQAHTLVTPLDTTPISAVQIPCACHTNPDYRKNQPNSWVTGFAVFYVRPDGTFNLYPVIAIGGIFTAPNGVIYD